MAGHLGLRSIAEGVETGEQAAFLAANGVSAMQGFHFARPLPVQELISLLTSRREGHAGAASGELPDIASVA
jgi:sensor c-di-GMP phosphodiesterase-like protein